MAQCGRKQDRTHDNKTNSAGRLSTLAMAFVWQVMLGSAQEAIDLQTSLGCTQAGNRDPDITRYDFALTAPKSVFHALSTHMALYLLSMSKQAVISC